MTFAAYLLPLAGFCFLANLGKNMIINFLSVFLTCVWPLQAGKGPVFHFEKWLKLAADFFYYLEVAEIG